MKSVKIRRLFIDFFKKKQHSIVASAPIVVKGDPTLMFTNSGMNQFKSIFLGNEKPSALRIANSQKCLRVSGKHNDLEEVGHDTYHHTMFEMLGNWSFGDYFKEEAIEWSWEFLTKKLTIPKSDLYVTVFKGNLKAGLEPDEESYKFWSKWVEKDHIVEESEKYNFWEMGNQGPCGPSSEIHIDLRGEKEKAEIPGKDLINKDHPKVIEIWNLVFMQFNRKADGSLENLPKKHIDTGMGLERLAMIIQNVESTYDTDIFTSLINDVYKLTAKPYGKDKNTDIAIRVIVDHLRAVAFSIADGQLPSNNGAGYVIRRILRRAIRYGYTFLNKKEPFIYELIDTLSREMGTYYEELVTQNSLIKQVVCREEKSFLKTIQEGIHRLEKVKKENSTDEIIDGKIAFELYDTYGFPLDLTMLILKESGFALDVEGFNLAMKKQKDRSRFASVQFLDDWVLVLKDSIHSEFVGHDCYISICSIVQYRKVKNQKAEFYQIVLDRTPFYAEGGGQVGDIGVLRNENEKIDVFDTKNENGIIVHYAKKLPKDMYAKLEAIIDYPRRRKIEANHSATHLLHQALRQTLGKHVEQKGSLVRAESLRFDFSHFEKIGDEDLKKIQDFVNRQIEEDIPLQEKKEIPKEKALSEGALALFGEKYESSVRVVGFGKSIELCGGTHVSSISLIWHFKIVFEGAISSGVRRIEAITGITAKEYFKKVDRELESIGKLVQKKDNIANFVKKIQEENIRLKAQIKNLTLEKEARIKKQIADQSKTIGDIRFIASKTDLDAKSLKNISFKLGKEYDDLFLLLTGMQSSKALLSLYISNRLSEAKSLDAGKIIKQLGKHINGEGGGQSFYATAGGKNISGLKKAMEEALIMIESL